MREELLIFMLVLVMGGCGSQTSPKSNTEILSSIQDQTQFSAQDFAQLINHLTEATILDVRTPQEYRKGHIHDAMNADWNNSRFDEMVSELDKSEPVLVYCLSGGRSAQAVERLENLGFKQIYEMPGGMMEWRSEELPIDEVVVGDEGMNESDYNEMLNKDHQVLVDFYAEWCIPCKKMKPYLDKIRQDETLDLEIVRINVDEHQELCKSLKVVALPELRLYDGDEMLWRHVGYMDETDLRRVIADNQ